MYSETPQLRCTVASAAPISAGRIANQRAQKKGRVTLADIAGATPRPAMRLIDRFELNGDTSRTDFNGDYTRRRRNRPVAKLEGLREQMVVQFLKFSSGGGVRSLPLVGGGATNGYLGSQVACLIKGSHL